MISRTGNGVWTAADVCAEIASIFRVRTTEVGLLQLRNGALTFVFPGELGAVGSIPLSSSAIAARTAQNRNAEIFNRFADVKHHTVFERIKIPNEGTGECQIIQKLMSAAVIGGDGSVLGVLQVSRKGITPAAAGADFTAADLECLQVIANEVASLMSLMTDTQRSTRQLKFLS